ncbi:ectopic P granules protein 5 homolog [Pollicipes pollicipes]|uniref:ectopic P granules protein 5 homolog n=1 Tax=Pollicipes pollicipes TaxID=41117 RepID=UPI001884FC1E|nr:ectopic P granules protein 5 homolog [Pollicipes pollicipes]
MPPRRWPWTPRRSRWSPARHRARRPRIDRPTSPPPPPPPPTTTTDAAAHGGQPARTHLPERATDAAESADRAAEHGTGAAAQAADHWTVPTARADRSECSADAAVSADRTSEASTDASVAGSPFTALAMPEMTAHHVLYPDLAACEFDAELAADGAEPSAPVAESPATPLSLSSSQVSISEGPFFFETEKKASMLCLGQEVTPLTDAELAEFYRNEELASREQYAELFVREYGPDRADEFDALVEGYRRAGAALRASAREHEQLHEQYEGGRSRCWDLARSSVRGEAECDDGRSLSASHEFRRAVLDKAALEDLRRALAALRCLLHDAHALHAFSLLQARLQVETHLHRLTAGFLRTTRSWLLRLAALLLRLGTVNDHLFVLHQVLRCPSGWAQWAAPLLQPPRPDVPAGLDHAITALAVMLSPVRERAQFLALSGRLERGEDEWVMLEDEEDEAEKTAGYLKLQEADLVALFNQLPWADLMRHMLRMGRGPDGADVYDPAFSTSRDLLHLFACASQIIAILAAGLAEYCGTTHRQLNKRLCHQVLHLVHYVTDHWESYSVTSSDDMATKGRLLVEYDSFVCRSAVRLLASPRLAVWHFLASFPFGRLTPRTAWKLLWLFHTSGRAQETDSLPAVPQDQDDAWAAEVFSPTFHSMFEHQLVHMSQSEVYFRLTALANMAMARGHRERTFIKAVTRDLVQVSFVTLTTRELCSRSGRDLLAAVCNRHPFVISYTLSLTQEHMQTMGKIALYLFSGLPLRLWRPSGSDMAQVCSWLAEHALDSVESRLAQLVLARLDWGVRPYSPQLALPAEFHRAERRFQDWAWTQVELLRLHVAALEEACRQDQPLASYATLLMTADGHSVPLLLERGLSRLTGLVASGRPAAVAHLLELVVPLFVDNADALAHADALPLLLQTIVTADQSYLKMMKTLVVAGQPGPLLLQVAGVIERHVTGHRCYGLQWPVPLVTLWLRSLTSVPAWSRHTGILYLINQLLRASFSCRPARDQAELIIRQLISSAGLSSLLAWVSGGTLQPLLPASSLPQAPWLAWFCLRAETRLEAESGLWHDLIATLCEDRQLPLEQALKRVCSQQRLPQTPAQSLALYRWAQQALDTDLDCPLLPAFWQHFFALYLARVYDIGGRDQGSVGDRFLEGMVNVQYQKRLKRRLQESAEHHRRCAEEAETRGGEVIDGEVAQRRHIAQMFGTFALWLEEPRLHRPDLNLADLPAVYNPTKLLDLLQQVPDGDVWEEFINYRAVARQSEVTLQQRAASHHNHRHGRGSAASTPVRSEDTPANRIVKRLHSYDARAPPPEPEPFLPTVPGLAASLFSAPEAALAGLQPALDELTRHARWFVGVTAEHSALDCQYLELLPELYTNELTQVVQRISCEPAGHRCSGPATVLLQCETARLDGGVYHRIDDNRQLAARLERLEAYIQALVRRYRQDGLYPPLLQRIGARLFHHIVSNTTEETRQCPAVSRLLSACLDVLGQTFVQQHAAECGPLLEAILRQGALLDQLSPHLTPAAADADTFVRLYETLSCVSRDKSEIVLPLLEKFDLETWLERQRPSLAQRSALLSVLVGALSAFGPHPERPEWAPLHALYRRHLTQLHRHQFPEHYGEVLQRLLDASRDNRLSVMCWYDFVNVLAADAAEFTAQMDDEQRRLAVAAVAGRPGPLQSTEALHTCKLLASRFLQERLEGGLYGLYPRYKLYTAPLSVLLALVASRAVIGAIQNDRGSLSDRLLAELWLMLRDTFAPWLSPLSLSDRQVWQRCAAWMQQLTADKQHLPAWVPGDGPHAHMMLTMFLHCVMMLNNTLPAARPALSHLWEHYCTVYALPSVPEHVRALVQAELLTLPWDRLSPQLHDVERMVQLLDVYLPEAHSFAAQVVVQLPWREVVEVYERESPTASVRLHLCLFAILVKVAFEPKIRQSGALFLLLSRAEAFGWHLLDAATYQRVLSWYIMSCDPVSVLETEAREPVDVALIGFLQVAAGHVSTAARLHPEASQKRTAYVSGVVRLLVNAAATHKSLVTAQPHGFTRTLLRLLQETELIVAKMSPDEGFREATLLTRELLQCASARSPAPLQNLCASRLTKWVAEESSSVLLCPMLRTSGTTIYDMQHLSNFWEALMSTILAKESSAHWLDLAQLAEFPAASVERLLTASQAAGNLLVLHLYLLQRLQAEAEPRQLAASCVHWLTELTMLSDSAEPKLCLLLHQALLLLERLAAAGFTQDVCRHARALAAALLTWGEDRDGSGMLGAIGLGRRSPFSTQFRLLCRVMAATLLSQLWADGSLRLEPVPEEPTERLSSDSAASSDTKWGLPHGLLPEAYQAFERLTALRSRRDYAPLLQTLEEAVADVLSPASTFGSCRPALVELVRRSYHDPCLHQLL